MFKNSEWINDKDILSACCHQNGLAIQYVTHVEKDLAMIACQQNGRAWAHVPASVRDQLVAADDGDDDDAEEDMWRMILSQAGAGPMLLHDILGKHQSRLHTRIYHDTASFLLSKTFGFAHLH